MQRKVLIVAGERGEALAKALGESAYACARAEDGQSALSLAESGRFDLAVLDAETLGSRGAELVSLLHAKGHFPILVISPAGGNELVNLLNAGADDYLTRPFELRELIARIEIQLRRFGSAQPRGALHHKALSLDPNTFCVTLCDRPVRLTRQEFRILELMLLSPQGRVFSKQDFFDYAWDCGYAGVDKTINVHICNIRKKFREITSEPYIETIWGLGFRLV